MTSQSLDPETHFQCRHIFTDGRRCGSPALRGPEGRPDENQPFCYFHHRSRRPIQDAPARKRRQSRFTLPDPEDRSAIQHSIGEVLRRIASNEVDPRRAGLLLYGLQIASLNLPRSIPGEKPQEPVSEITHDPQHGLLAPPAELGHDKPLGSAQRLLLELSALEQADFDRQLNLQRERDAELREREAELARREAELRERERHVESQQRHVELLRTYYSPETGTRYIDNSYFENPAVVANPDIENPIGNPVVANPAIENADFENPDIDNPNLGDRPVADDAIAP